MKAMVILCGVAVTLPGCVSAGVEGVRIAADKMTVSNNIELASQGDPVAQYKVGKALCCGIFYDTKAAIFWLCASARQGYGPAMYKIGKIYSGDLVDGVRALRRAAMGVAGARENLTVAYVWLRQADDRGVPDAADRAQRVWEDLSQSQRDEATRMLQPGQEAKCSWDIVIDAQE